jgi:hypothetical protein
MISKEEVNNAVLEFCIEVIKEPLLFFNEYDLHLLLVEKLYQFNQNLKEKKFFTNLSYDNSGIDKYQTRLIHREYGRGNSTRGDIVIFDEDDVKHIGNSHLTFNDKTDYLLPKFAFELGISLDDTKKHVENDIDKLSKLKKNGSGYIIHIIRNDNKKESIRKRKNIEDKFKNYIFRTKDKNLFNIKIITIILNIYKKEEESYCEIYHKSNNEWIEFNRNDIKQMTDIIRSQL